MIYVCIIHIQIPHEVKIQRAINKRTSHITKSGQYVILLGQLYYVLQIK